jgi:hypothetical protein
MAFLATPAYDSLMKRSGEPQHTTDDVHAACVEDLYKSVPR